MTTETKELTLGAALSVTTGRLLCPLGDLYDILGWMTGESLMTHQLPRAGAAAKPDLLKQHPVLGSHEMEIAISTLIIQLDTADKIHASTQDLLGIVSRWLAGAPGPKTLEVKKMANFKPMDPITELFQMIKDSGREAVLVAAPEAQ